MRGVFLLEDLGTFSYNVMNAKTAHFYSRKYGEINQKQKQNIQKNNLKRWKREFKKNLNETIKEGKFECLVRIPYNVQASLIDVPEEEIYGSEIFVEWLKEKGYRIEVDLIWFIINW